MLEKDGHKTDCGCCYCIRCSCVGGGKMADIEIKNAKQFWTFIAGIVIAGLAYLFGVNNVINKIMKARKEKSNVDSN
jgi:hypothetical protein